MLRPGAHRREGVTEQRNAETQLAGTPAKARLLDQAGDPARSAASGAGSRRGARAAGLEERRGVLSPAIPPCREAAEHPWRRRPLLDPHRRLPGHHETHEAGMRGAPWPGLGCEGSRASARRPRRRSASAVGELRTDQVDMVPRVCRRRLAVAGERDSCIMIVPSVPTTSRMPVICWSHRRATRQCTTAQARR
jgi:hypothetical protein